MEVVKKEVTAEKSRASAYEDYPYNNSKFNESCLHDMPSQMTLITP